MIIHLLENLAIAVAQTINDGQVQAMRQVATELESIEMLPTWLPEMDFRFYLGLAQFYGNRFEAAEATLSSITPDSLGAAEAYFLLIKILSKRLTEKNKKIQLSQIFGHYQKIAHLYPYSSTVQYVANVQTDQREAVLGNDSELWSVPAFEVGRLYEWQELITVGDLYYEQNLFKEAANAYHWSIQVRDLYEWLESSLVAEMWVKIADCYEQKAEQTLAARYLAKSFALPLTTSQISEISTRLKTLLALTESKQASPVSKPDALKLQQIGDMLFEMEMFDEAIKAYRQAEQQGSDMKLVIASVLEAKAQFLFDYRLERTEAAILFGKPLSMAIIAQAYQKAKQSYLHTQPQTHQSILGIQRCNEALIHLNPQKPKVKHETSEHYEFFSFQY
jgi:tetratricopeptide (TPR) repeat protein